MVALIALVLAADPAWETVATGAITVKTRAIPNTPVREVLAEGDLDADPRDVQAAWMNVDRYPKFMPYVKDARVVGAARGSERTVYTAVSLPIIAPRDFVVTDRLVSTLDSDGGGAFVDEWQVAPHALPERSNVIRLKTNTGRTTASAAAGGKTHLTYQFAIDPGGYIPASLADLGNRTCVPDVFRAVETEAKRLHAERAKRE